MNYTVISIVIAYFLILLLVSIKASKKVVCSSDFSIARRSFGPFLLGGALVATEIGGGSSLGVIEKAYGNWGMGAMWYVITIGIAFIALAFVAPKLRLAQVKTVPEYFKERYGSISGIITALFMVFFPMIGFTIAQFVVSGVLISAITGLSYKIAVFIVASLVIIYTILGGIWSVARSNLVQVFVITVGMLISVPFVFQYAGGWENVLDTLGGAGKLGVTQGIGWKTIISLIVMYIASFGVGQEVTQKFYSAKNTRIAWQASLLASVVFILYALIPTTLGVVVYSIVKSNVVGVDVATLNDAKYVFPVLIMHILHPGFVGILFAGLIGATISCASSDLLGGGTIFSNDIYKTFLNKKATDKQILMATRVAVAVLGVLSMLITQINTRGIIEILMFSFALRASGFFFPYILGHYWKKANWLGAIASMIFGVATVFLTHYGFVPALFGMESVIPGLIVSLFSFVLFTNLHPTFEQLRLFLKFMYRRLVCVH